MLQIAKNMESHNLEMDLSHLDINGRKRRYNDFSDSVDNSLVQAQKIDENVQVRRSHRKRIRSVDTSNKIALSKQTKCSGNIGTKETMNYYLDKRIKRLPPTLETIFEEPRSDNLMSTRKFKRCIHFSDDGLCKDKHKIKKRSMKAKKLSPASRKKKKVSLEMLIQKLSKIEESDEMINSLNK